MKESSASAQGNLFSEKLERCNYRFVRKIGYIQKPKHANLVLLLAYNGSGTYRVAEISLRRMRLGGL